MTVPLHFQRALIISTRWLAPLYLKILEIFSDARR